MNPILVRNIKHLTDARYFAAMGVDWMSMQLTSDPTTFSIWHMLKDWIAGVKLAAEIPADDEMLLAKTIIDAIPDGIILNQLIVPDVPQTIRMFYEVDEIDKINGKGGLSFILSYDSNLSTSNKILEIPSNKIFLQSSWTLYKLNSLIESGYKGGICFSGGEEDKTGLRDFSVMDDMFRVLGR